MGGLVYERADELHGLERAAEDELNIIDEKIFCGDKLSGVESQLGLVAPVESEHRLKSFAQGFGVGAGVLRGGGGGGSGGVSSTTGFSSTGFGAVLGSSFKSSVSGEKL